MRGMVKNQHLRSLRVFNYLRVVYSDFWYLGFPYFTQEEVVRLLGEEMKKSEKANGFVIDGFPANLNQGMMIILS